MFMGLVVAATLATLALTAAKLTGLIDWSWWWVAAPVLALWVVVAVVLVFVMVASRPRR